MVKTAIILAGGKGERLKPYTNDRPKPMVEIGGKPILEYQLEQLKLAGVEQVIFTLSYKKEAVMDWVGDGSKYGLKVTYSIEETPLGRGGAIKKAMKELGGDWDSVVGLNGDNLWQIDLKQVFEVHKKNNALITLVVSSLKSPYGIADIDSDNHITGYREKPPLPYWLNDGIYVISKEALELLPDIGDQEDYTFPFLPPERFIAFKNEGYWRGIDTVKDLLEAEKEVKEIFSSTA